MTLVDYSAIVNDWEHSEAALFSPQAELLTRSGAKIYLTDAIDYW
jgi:hypothetical protein